jgi:hypothetical protein
LRAEAQFLQDVFTARSTEAQFDKTMATLFLQLVMTLRSFTWPSSIRSLLPEDAMATLGQASSLMQFVEKYYDKAKAVEKWQTIDFEELEKVCRNFHLENGWATHCCRKGSDEDFQREFAVDFTMMYYPDATQAEAFTALVLAHGAEAKLEAFAKSIPIEFSSLQLPKSYEALHVGDLLAVSSTIGDSQLQQQLQYVCSAHSLLSLTSKLAALRAADPLSADGRGRRPGLERKHPRRAAGVAIESNRHLDRTRRARCPAAHGQTPWRLCDRR